ncbi:hypothetical protein GN958_ATG22619 [Phytophthora infestans]|uniref:Uncharacterized protein n=1 Tax=Phytophthora infestans TaxID=4787 RepID=A0A8S9TNR1_PHYIN|nr:hypothetical protein GN958_ATG22619 [Phytophthora infestans]
MDSSFLGVAVTSSGTFDATLAAALDRSYSDEALDEEDSGVAYEDEVNDEEVISANSNHDVSTHLNPGDSDGTPHETMFHLVLDSLVCQAHR